MSDERRRHERFAIRQMLEISFAREVFFQAEGLNISEGGMMCRTDYPVEPLTKVYLIVSIPGKTGEHLLKTEGTVIHTRKEAGEYVFGVTFNDLGEQDIQALQAYLQSLERRKPA
jgi:c-di-GMP-binding flagellar brake protein YcgR